MFTSNIQFGYPVRGVGGKLSRLVYLAPHPGFGSNSVISYFLLHHNLGIFSCKRYKHYFSQTEMFTSNIQFGYSSEEWGASCPGWFILPPAKDLCQTFLSVNSHGTIILEYLVVRDVNFISAKLRCLRRTFSLVTLSEGWGASCPGWFILLPTQDLGQTVSSVISYCTIILEYLVVRDINIISVKLRCLHPTFSLVTRPRSGGKLSRLVYLAPRQGFGSNSVIS